MTQNHVPPALKLLFTNISEDVVLMMILMAMLLVTDMLFFSVTLHILGLILIVTNIYQVTRYQRWFLTMRKDNTTS